MKNGVEVFDCKEEDELTEFAASELFTKFKNPNHDNPTFLKCDFLECVSQGSDVEEKMGISTIACIDAEAIECNYSSNDATASHAPLGMVREVLASHEDNSIPDTALQSSLNFEKDPCSIMDKYESKGSFTEQKATVSCQEAPSPGKCQSDCALMDSPSNSEPVNVKSDANGSLNEKSPSSPASDTTNNALLNGYSSDNCFSSSEMDIINVGVDYVVYRDTYRTGCLITFSYDGIKISGMPAYGEQETFSFERRIDDIIRIESQYLHRFGTVTVKLHVLSKDAAEATEAYRVEQLEFAVFETNWSRLLEAIASLNVKYLALSAIRNTGVTVNGEELLQQRPYFPTFGEDVEDVVYPEGDSDAVSISKRDFDLLQPETFVNDTIIDFYIKYLKNQIPPEKKQRFHFFNSFFFRKLADLDKDPSSASDGRAAFLRVHKWTRKVDIFGKDYVFIPVNFNLHWSLLVICHPGEVAGFKDEDLGKSVRVPCILHMDSIKGTHAGLKNLVQSYLCEEWKARQEMSKELSSKFLNLRFIPLELPQQENSFDCGLFLLHYLELFLVEAPLNFSPFKINKLSKFLNVNWFPPVEASLKRTPIQRLISGLFGNHAQELSSGDCGDDKLVSAFPENARETKVQLVSERCSPTVACHGNLSSSSDASQGIEITLLEASSMRNNDCVDDPGLVLREFFEPGVAAGPLLAQCSSYDQSSYYRLNSAMSQQIEQDNAETGEQFMFFHSGDSIFQQMTSISMQGEDDGSSSETSVCASDNSDIVMIENCPIQKDVDLFQKEKIDEERFQSMENMECLTERLASGSSEMRATSATKDTEDPERIHVGNENGDLAFCRENPIIENALEHHINERAEFTGDDVQTMGCQDVNEEAEITSNDIQAMGHEHINKEAEITGRDIRTTGHQHINKEAEITGKDIRTTVHQHINEEAETSGNDIRTLGHRHINERADMISDDMQTMGHQRINEKAEITGDDMKTVGHQHVNEKADITGDDMQTIYHQHINEKADITSDDMQTMGHQRIYKKAEITGDDVQSVGHQYVNEKADITGDDMQSMGHQCIDEKAEITGDDVQSVGHQLVNEKAEITGDDMQTMGHQHINEKPEIITGDVMQILGHHRINEKAEITSDDMQTLNNQRINEKAEINGDDMQTMGHQRIIERAEITDTDVRTMENQHINEKAEVTHDDVQMMGDSLMAESNEKEATNDRVMVESDEQADEQAAKRRRVSPPHEGEGDLS